MNFPVVGFPADSLVDSKYRVLGELEELWSRVIFEKGLDRVFLDDQQEFFLESGEDVEFVWFEQFNDCVAVLCDVSGLDRGGFFVSG